MKLDSKIPAGPLADKWNNHKAKLRLVNPANRRKYHVIVVGSGLAGSAAAASFARSKLSSFFFFMKLAPLEYLSILLFA